MRLNVNRSANMEGSPDGVTDGDVEAKARVLQDGQISPWLYHYVQVVAYF